MLHAALLVTALGTSPPPASTSLAIARCLATMDGAVYHGDPTDRMAMERDVTACVAARRAAERVAVSAERGPEKLYVLARLLDRAATLTFMGLDDPRTALREMREANLYFRIASALPGESAEYHAAALDNAELTAVRTRTLQQARAVVAARVR